jgi:hypothetical protein
VCGKRAKIITFVFFEEKFWTLINSDSFIQEFTEEQEIRRIHILCKNLKKIIEDIVNPSGVEILYLSRSIFKVAGVSTSKLLCEVRFVEMQG